VGEPAPAAQVATPAPAPAPVLGQPVGTQTVQMRAQVSGAIAIAWVLTVLTGGYFLPWAIAATRQKRNTGTIGWINLLLGWTVIGWVVALVMSCMSDPV